MKEGALHREWSIWNKMNQNGSPIDSSFEITTKQLQPELSEKVATFEEVTTQYSPYVYMDEKYEAKKNKINLWKGFTSKLLLIPMVLLLLSRVSFNNTGCMHSSPLPKPLSLKNTNIQFNYANHSTPHEVIDIPLSPHKDISSPVYTQQLLQHSFALSWSKPISLHYSPPPSDIEYDRVILTLDTTVDGVQYDRMVHIYLNNNEIWRSSTIEPNGQLSHSFTQKDVTLYYDLFDKEGELLVQLDNLITNKLTGVFNITLSALYLKDESKGPDKYGRTPSHPKIIPLTASKYGLEDPPIVYYPDSKLSLSLPTSPYNVTNLLLLLTTSGNAAEEFWFSNLLDKYRKTFIDNGRHFYGHGSCRVINVYADGVRVHSANPKPYIFSGGVAPTLWNSIVSTGAFDISPYLIDLTPVLPLMWDESITLDVEISNCIDDAEDAEVKSIIGSNWITSASLAFFENSDIVHSYGDIESIQNSTDIHTFSMNPPFSGLLTQIIKASYSNVFETNVTHVYKNGSEITELSKFENFVNQTSINLITKWGDVQSTLSLPKLNTTVTILNADTLKPIKEVTKLANSSFANKLQLLPQEEGSSDISFNVNMSIGIDIGAYKGVTPIFVINSKENGTAEFTIAGSGNNYGSGTMLHNYTLTDIRGHVYNRVALAENSTLVYDEITESNTTTNDQIPIIYEFKDSIFSMVDLDWLTTEEITEIENFFSYDEISEITNALLEVAF